MTANPVRNCVGCGQRDDAPRHVMVVGDTYVPWHLDCHVIAAACSVCEHQLAGVGGVDGNPKGDALREHLISLPPVEVEHVPNGDDSDLYDLTTAVITEA
ncbi:hypothetical protein [Dactylosporangium salmoneum]|uniref:Uncharacterized protein n=1 Tax=Dactylosporangium salmoneum TaxID=53361 RepID=A0ABN3GAF5_9ACTN